MSSPPRKRLALFFDGTWNEPADHTNVWRMDLMLAEADQHGVPQEKFYDEGVGTHFYDRLSGGAFGAGLPKNIRRGYRWLVENYEPDDEIYIFGFSRGAFTARGLAGMISKCGLLRPEAPISFIELFDRYRKGNAVTPIYQLIREKNQGVTLSFEESAILNHAYYRRDLIKMVGVWDTVGSLGVPFGSIPGVSRRTLSFINTRLSTTVQHSYQALALDEQRRPYQAILWTAFVPDAPPEEDASRLDDRMVEQRWFAGAHANVGGGYRSDYLPQRPLAWLQKKAESSGLAFRARTDVTDDDLAEQPTDSYAKFLGGLWRILTLGRRHIRSVMADPVKTTGVSPESGIQLPGTVVTVNERIDPSIPTRWQRDLTYRPPALLEWGIRKGFNVNEVMTHPDSYPDLWSDVETKGIPRGDLDHHRLKIGSGNPTADL